MQIPSEETAFPKLSASELDFIRHMAERRTYRDGDVVIHAGQPRIDFFVVESGRVEIRNPANHDAVVHVHEPGGFVGDIDMLTRRPIIVRGVARGPETVLLCVPGGDFRRLLTSVPRLGEKVIVAFEARRELLSRAGPLGIKLLGEGKSQQTQEIREFLSKNFVPYTWYDPAAPDGRELLRCLGKTPADLPIVKCETGPMVSHPCLRDIARCVGVRQECPDRLYDVAIVGAGPAGMTAAVYAASEGLSTVVLDSLGPGGQAGGSSLIENFIGFPAGLSGTELATRGVLQMLKFGALLVTPVKVVSVARRREELTLGCDDGTAVRASCVVAATGVRWRRLAARNAARFERAGVYYAATSVEARVCVGEAVAVVGGGNSAGQAAMFLSECARKAYLLVRGPDLGKSMSEYLVARIRANDRIEVRTNTEITEVLGEEKLEGAVVEDKARPGAVERLGVTSVFVFIGAEPYTDFLPEDVARDRHGFVLTGSDAKANGRWPLTREPCALETTAPGVLVAGDVRAGSTKRVAFAVGDGAMAVTCVHQLRSV